MPKEEPENLNFTKLAIATIAAVIILGGAVYTAYQYSQKQAGNIVLPGGVTYLGPSPTPPSPTPTETQAKTQTQQPPTAPLRFTTASDVAWNTQGGKTYPYSFAYPSTLPLVIFPGDMLDSVAIAWGNIPPQQNILVNMEFIDKRNANYIGNPKEFVENWHQFFSGLKDVAKVTPFTNTNGLKGYKASYINYADASPNMDVFFEVPDHDNMMIHVANGILDPKLFDRIVNSLKWNPPTQIPVTPTPS